MHVPVPAALLHHYCTIFSMHISILIVSDAANLIRCDEDTHQHQLLLEQSNSLHAVLDSLNSLGSFPWTINKRVSHVHN